MTGGIIVCLLFWGFQGENFTSGFQHQFTAVFALATAAFAALSAAAGAPDARRRDLWTLAAAALAALATASMANGLAAPGLLAALALVLRLPPSRVLALAALFLLLAAAYLTGYVSPSHHARPLDGLASVTIWLPYVCLYLGGAFGVTLADQLAAFGWAAPGVSQKPLSMAFGALALAGGAMAAWRAWTSPPDVRPPRLALVAAMAFIAATAFLTAVGRANFPAEQAFANRYGTPALAYWAILAVFFVLGGRGTAVAGRLTAATTALAALVLAAAQPLFMAHGARLGDSRVQGAAAAMAGVADWSVLPHVLPYEGYDTGEIARARQAGLGIFAQGWTASRGRPLATLGNVSGACGGSIDTVASAAGGGEAAWRLAGTLTGTPTEGIVVADEAGRVIGFGLVKDGRWTAYARSDAAHALAGYGVRRDGGGLCALDPATPRPVPPTLLPMPPAPPGAPVAMAAAIDGQWRNGGINAAVPPPPWSFASFGTGAVSDADRGRLSFTLEPGDARRLLIPIVTGPTPEDQRVRVRDAATGRLLAAIEAPADAKLWRLWRVRLPDDFPGGTVVVEAEDAGAAWGQWLGIGQPFAAAP
jgi:hypothetical protein